MKAIRKPKIGFLGVMLDLYEPMYPDIRERQRRYAQEVIDTLQEDVDFDFPGPVLNREEIEPVVKHFNDMSYDGILVVMLTYSPSFRSYNALRMNRLPVMLANIQPARTVAEDWDMSHLTFNQGIHGAQDMANALIRMGYDFPVVTADWRTDRFRSSVANWAHAARTAQEMQSMRIGQVGQMPTMGDIQTSTSSLMGKLGPIGEQNSMGLIYSQFEAVTETEIDAIVAENQRNFEIDANLSVESHRYASRLQVAIEKWLAKGNYDGFSIQFSAPSDDGRFLQLPMMAASNLMAKGYGYSAEGDILAATLVSVGQVLIGDAHFTEMYAMDFDRDSVLMSHMGEGNWKVARKDRPIRLIDRELGIGGLENPPTVLFSAEPGPATLVTLAALPGDVFRLLCADGEVLDSEPLTKVEMPYFHFRPQTGVQDCMDAWLNNGGTHHQCMNLGHHARRWEILCRILGIEFVRV